MLNCFGRRIVGWLMADHLRAELVIHGLEMALYRRRPDRGLIHHSEVRDSQGWFNRSSQRSTKGCDEHAKSDVAHHCP